MLQRVVNARIKDGAVEQVHLVPIEKYSHDFLEMMRVLLRQRMFQHMLHAASHMSKNQLLGEGREIEMRSGMVNRIGEVLPRISERAIEVEHDQIHRFFHRQRFKMKSISKSTR